MFFKKWAKSIAIVKKVMEISTNAIEEASTNGYSERNFYAKSECALLGLAAITSQVLTKNDKIAKGIVKEACSGTYRRFLGETHKEEYRESIHRNYDAYLTIVRTSFNDDSMNDEEKISNMYKRMAQHIIKEVEANDSPDSIIFFYDVVCNVNDWVERFCSL